MLFFSATSRVDRLVALFRLCSISAVADGEVVLQTLETCFYALFAHHSDAFTLYDCDGKVISQNVAAVRLRRISAWDDALKEPSARATIVEAYRGIAGAFELSLASSEGELRIRVDVAPIVFNEEIIGISEIARDVRVTFAEEDKQDTHGKTPSLPILYDRMARLLVYMRRDGRPFALHLISTCPEMTLPAGSQREFDDIVVDRLLETVRGTDTVARFGKNFIIVQAELLDHDGVNSMVNRIDGVLQLPFTVNHMSIAGNPSIGTAIASRRTVSVDDLLAEADLALTRRRFSGFGGTIRRIESA